MTPRKYQFVEVINLGLNGNGETFLGEGWSTPMDVYNWSCAGTATLDIAMEQPRRDLAFSVKLIPNVHPELLPQQRIGVLANGEKVADWVAENKRGTQFSTLVPKNLAASGHIKISFELPDAASPGKLGYGADFRKLAIALYSFKLDLIDTRVQDNKP